MKKSLLAFTLLVASTGITGCGTLLNLQEKAPPPYGGVIMESKIIAQGVPMGPFAFFPNFDVPGLWPLALIDLPFSFVGDTVTLPMTTASASQK